MESPEQTPAQTKRTVWTFALASFFHDAGSDMILSIWPMFLTTVLGANMSAVGLIDGLGDAVVSIAQAISGYASDRMRKRKIFVWLGYLFSGISKIGYAFAPAWQWVIPFRILDRSGKMRGAPRDAIVSDLSSLENRGRHFGILRMMDNAGAMLGIITTIFLIRFLPVRTIIFFASVPSLIAVFLVILLYKEIDPDGSKVFRGIRFKDISPSLKLYTALNAVFMLGSFSYSFLLLSAQSAGFAIGTIPVLYLLYTAIAAGLSLQFGKLADRIGRKPVLLFSFACWIAVTLLFLFVNSKAGVIAAMALYGVHIASLDPVQKAFTAELAPKGFTASTLGGFQMIMGFVSFFASFLAGILWDGFGMQYAYLLSLALTICATVMLVFLKTETQKPF